MEKERLKFSIDRFDHYYDSVNNKGNVILGLATFIVGGLIAGYPALLNIVECTFLLQLNIIALITIGLAAMLVMIFASTPHLTTKSNSVLYFLSISKMSKDNFINLSKELSEEEELDDMRNQTYILAEGLSSKFQKLKVASRLIAIQFILLIPLIILLITQI